MQLFVYLFSILLYLSDIESAVTKNHCIQEWIKLDVVILNDISCPMTPIQCEYQQQKIADTLISFKGADHDKYHPNIRAAYIEYGSYRNTEIVVALNEYPYNAASGGITNSSIFEYYSLIKQRCDDISFERVSDPDLYGAIHEAIQQFSVRPRSDDLRKDKKILIFSNCAASNMEQICETFEKRGDRARDRRNNRGRNSNGLDDIDVLMVNIGQQIENPETYIMCLVDYDERRIYVDTQRDDTLFNQQLLYNLQHELCSSPTPTPTTDPTEQPIHVQINTVSPTLNTPNPTQITFSPTVNAPSPTDITASPTDDTFAPTFITPSPTDSTSSSTTNVTPLSTVNTPSPTTNTVSSTIDTRSPTDDTSSPTINTPSPTDITSSSTTNVTPLSTVNTPSPTDITSSPTQQTKSPTVTTVFPTNVTPSPTSITLSPTTDTGGPTQSTSNPTGSPLLNTASPTETTITPTVVATLNTNNTASSTEPHCYDKLMDLVILVDTATPMTYTECRHQQEHIGEAVIAFKKPEANKLTPNVRISVIEVGSDDIYVRVDIDQYPYNRQSGLHPNREIMELYDLIIQSGGCHINGEDEILSRKGNPNIYDGLICALGQFDATDTIRSKKILIYSNSKTSEIDKVCEFYRNNRVFNDVDIFIYNQNLGMNDYLECLVNNNNNNILNNPTKDDEIYTLQIIPILEQLMCS